MGSIFENQSCFYDHISSHRAKWNTRKQWRKDAQRRYSDREKSLINRQRRLNKRFSDAFGTKRPWVRIPPLRPKNVYAFLRGHFFVTKGDSNPRGRAARHKTVRWTILSTTVRSRVLRAVRRSGRQADSLQGRRRIPPLRPKILIRKNGDFTFLLFTLHFSLFSTLLYRGFLEVISNSE